MIRRNPSFKLIRTTEVRAYWHTPQVLYLWPTAENFEKVLGVSQVMRFVHFIKYN